MGRASIRCKNCQEVLIIDGVVQLFVFVGVEVEGIVADTEVGGHFFGFLRGIEIFLIGDCWAFMRVATRRRPPLDLVGFNFHQKLEILAAVARGEWHHHRRILILRVVSSSLN